jgi:two-component system sensor histidine kinase BaeS
MRLESEVERMALLVHEVRSPVAALAAIAEAMREERLDRKAVQELSRLAFRACRSIERIVGDAALGSLRLERTAVRRLLEDAVAAARLEGAAVVLGEAPDVEIQADAVRLRQALDNLIRNAIAHSQATSAVVVAAHVDESTLLIAVSDTGRGIPPADQQRIFEPGARLDGREEGRGLGLPVVRAVAEAHGGTATVASEPGHGATFTIALPLR